MDRNQKATSQWWRSARSASGITWEGGRHGISLPYQLLIQAKCKERAKRFTFSKIGIKTGLVIREENEIRSTYTISIPFFIKT